MEQLHAHHQGVHASHAFALQVGEVVARSVTVAAGKQNVGLLHPSQRDNGNYAARGTHYATRGRHNVSRGLHNFR